MLQFFHNNAGTLIVGIVVLAIVTVIIIKQVVDKKKGAGCGCGCDDCASSASCSGETKLP